MSAWYGAVTHDECWNCGVAVEIAERALAACPHCGWTAEKQRDFDRKYPQFVSGPSGVPKGAGK